MNLEVEDAQESMEVEVAQESMEEDTEEEDTDRVTTPDLVREFSDLVEFGEPADTLNLVLDSSTESGVEAEQHVEPAAASQQPEQKKPAADAGEEGQMVMEEEDMGEGEAEYMLQRMFAEEFEHDDNVEVLLSSDSDDSMMSE